MSLFKYHRDSDHPEIGSDVEIMLQAIQRHTSGEIKLHMDNAHAPSARSEEAGRFDCRELGEAFELDVHDYASCEVNR